MLDRFTDSLKNPWEILGWITLAVLVYAVALTVISNFCIWFGIKLRCWSSRHIPLAEGQTWIQDGHPLHVKRKHVTDNGVVFFNIDTGGAMWSETQEQWDKRCRNRTVYLEKP